MNVSVLHVCKEIAQIKSMGFFATAQKVIPVLPVTQVNMIIATLIV